MRESDISAHREVILVGKDLIKLPIEVRFDITLSKVSWFDGTLSKAL